MGLPLNFSLTAVLIGRIHRLENMTLDNLAPAGKKNLRRFMFRTKKVDNTPGVEFVFSLFMEGGREGRGEKQGGMKGGVGGTEEKREREGKGEREGE